MPQYRLGVDIGGTFTDFVLMDEETGALHFGKTLTTQADPSEAVINGMADLLRRHDIRAASLKGIVHGTTLVTNAVIERKGAKTALLTTHGFRDILDIGRELRYDIYDIFLTMPEPIVPRDLRFDVPERVNKDGEVLTPLNKEALLGILEKVLESKGHENGNGATTHPGAGDGVKAVAVCYLHSFMNPQNERETAELIRAHYPGVHVSLSSDVLPEIREYERSVATAINAYVQPVAEQYLSSLENKLEGIGFEGVLHIMVSSGRLTTVEGAKATPIQLLESGPAGGSMAGVFYGTLIERKNLLCFDMGGTTAKASMIRDGTPEITNDFEAARVRRFRRGSGLPVRIPVIDMIEIGAGGGSIAHMDRLGLLRVGPESSGAEPGPACYALGGGDPTVTDADLLLGYLNPGYFLGGRMTLDVKAATRSVEEKVAKPLGVDAVTAALGIHRVVNENMANAARVHILEKGMDPRSFTMMAFGGAGPVHAYQVARLLKIPQLVVPLGAGVLSALGFLVSPVAVEHVRSYLRRLDAADWNAVNALLDEMEEEGRELMRSADIPNGQVAVTRSADMRYSGQGHEINVAIPQGTLGPESVEQIRRNFYQKYEELYGRYMTNVAVESVSWRVLVSGPSPRIQFSMLGESGEHSALKGKRHVYFPESHGFEDCPVYDRYLLTPGSSLEGPAVIEERESTLVVGPASRVTIDEYYNAVVDLTY